MFWADQIVSDIEKAFPGKRKFILRDEKTASGRVHVGSLRGVVIHAVVTQALIEKGYDAEFFFEINDADPMDGLPVYLSEKFRPYMGKPLKDVPPPDEKGAPDLKVFQKNPMKNFGRYYGDEFIEVIRSLGFSPTFYYASESYAQGKFDRWIDIVLDYPDEIRKVYKEVSGSEKGEEWNPLQVVCEKCGKVGTTTVIGSTGEKGKKVVEYVCEPEKVKWAIGCGYRGKVSPYLGSGKLPWKVEWGVKWSMFPVDIEGSGKDHQAAGGSHDVAAGIVNQVLKKTVSSATVPFNIPYEHFLIGGVKMSASKGLGASAKEVADMLPPELLRFLMARAWPHQHLDFDPSGNTLPWLFDLYDEAAEIFFGRKTIESAEDVKRAFHFSQLDSRKTSDHFRPRFSRVAFIIQMPQLDFLEEIWKLKIQARGETNTKIILSEKDKNEADLRRRYAKKWLWNFAPESEKFTVQNEMSNQAKILTKDQRNFLAAVASLLKQKTWAGKALHTELHELRKKSPLRPAEAFQAIYLALLGKTSGPQAGWFLEALDKNFVIERFEQAANFPEYQVQEAKDAVSSLCIIRREVCERFPGIKLGFNVLRGAHISKTHPDLEQLRERLWEGFDFESLKKNSTRLEAFREIYRGFGVKPSTNKPSPVALMSRLANGKPLPSINVAVDIYNALVVKHQLSIGLFDLDTIVVPVELRFAKGGEMFQGLGAEKAVPLMPGELCYFDAKGLVMARDFNYLDSEFTKVTEKTTDIFINIDGTHAVTQQDVEACLAELEELLVKYCGGTLGERVFVIASV